MQLLSTLVAVGALATTVSAHATVYGIWVNGAFKGDGRNQYIRSPPNNNPVKDIAGTQINCNVNNRQVSSTVSVKAGDQITFEWSAPLILYVLGCQSTD